ncbi:MAG: hypothetical protein KJ607_07535, partial [Bacteroidetes bacterium]|nr:hypothetical protein [Bacteroidota bacterium]
MTSYKNIILKNFTGRLLSACAIAFLVTLACSRSCGQVIWSEDFESNNVGDQFLDSPGGKWWTTAANCDSDPAVPGTVAGNYWGVYNNGGNKVFRVNDIEGPTLICGVYGEGSGQGASDNFWYSEVIDIVMYPIISVSAVFEVAGSSDMECDGCGSDSLKLSYMAYYSGTGWTSWMDFQEYCGANAGSVDSGCVMVVGADSLRLRIMAGNQANDEIYHFDDVVVSVGGGGCCPTELITADYT